MAGLSERVGKLESMLSSLERWTAYDTHHRQFPNFLAVIATSESTSNSTSTSLPRQAEFQEGGEAGDTDAEADSLATDESETNQLELNYIMPSPSLSLLGDADENWNQSEGDETEETFTPISVSSERFPFPRDDFLCSSYAPIPSSTATGTGINIDMSLYPNLEVCVLSSGSENSLPSHSHPSPPPSSLQIGSSSLQPQRQHMPSVNVESRLKRLSTTPATGAEAEEGYECEHCLIKIGSFDELSSHLRTHDQGAGFTTEKEKEHENEEPISSRTKPKTNIKRPFRCPHCASGFTRSNHLTRHILNLHKKPKRPNAINANPASQLIMKTPTATATAKIKKAIKCPKCETSLANDQNLKRHMARFHDKSGEPKFKCPHSNCSKGFLFKCDVMRHLRTHENKNEMQRQYQTFSCPQCPVQFTKRDCVERHIRQFHEGRVKFRCPHCSRVFKDGYQLRAHVKSHTNNENENDNDNDNIDNQGQNQNNHVRMEAEFDNDNQQVDVEWEEDSDSDSGLEHMPILSKEEYY